MDTEVKVLYTAIKVGTDEGGSKDGCAGWIGGDMLLLLLLAIYLCSIDIDNFGLFYNIFNTNYTISTIGFGSLDIDYHTRR